MNKLLFSEGGQPFSLDDLEFLQNGSVEPLRAIATSLGNCILGGCAIAQEDMTIRWTDGYISFTNSVYRVQAGSLVKKSALEKLYWVFSRSVENIVIFEDGSEHPTREVYSARLIASETNPSEAYLDANLVPYLGKNIARRPHLSYTSSVVEVLDFQELSPYTGVLTVRFSGALPLSTPFGTFELSGVVHLNGQARFRDREISIKLDKGRFVATYTSGEYPSGSVRLPAPEVITIPLTWCYPSDESSNPSDNGGIRGRR